MGRVACGPRMMCRASFGVGATLAILILIGEAVAASFAILDSERGNPVGDGRQYLLSSPGGAVDASGATLAFDVPVGQHMS